MNHDTVTEAEVKIRPAEPEDAPAIAEMERRCFSSSWSEEQILSEISADDRAYVAIAETGGRAVGYAYLLVAADEGLLYNIAVDPAFRRRHIGKNLMDNLTEHCRKSGCVLITLEVRESNYAARRLYNSLGFTDTAVRRGYYEDNNEDAILMDLRI